MVKTLNVKVFKSGAARKSEEGVNWVQTAVDRRARTSFRFPVLHTQLFTRLQGSFCLQGWLDGLDESGTWKRQLTNIWA
jgi:hypothetical protein